MEVEFSYTTFCCVQSRESQTLPTPMCAWERENQKKKNSLSNFVAFIKKKEPPQSPMMCTFNAILGKN